MQYPRIIGRKIFFGGVRGGIGGNKVWFVVSVQAEQRAAQLLSLNARLREDTEKMLSDQQQQQQQLAQPSESATKSQARSSGAAAASVTLHSTKLPAAPNAPAARNGLHVAPTRQTRPSLAETAGSKAGGQAVSAQVVVPAGVSGGAALDVRLADGAVARVRVPAGAHAGSILQVCGRWDGGGGASRQR